MKMLMVLALHDGQYGPQDHLLAGGICGPVIRVPRHGCGNMLASPRGDSPRSIHRATRGVIEGV